MALTEQMKEAIQADIADESSKKERIAKQVEGLKSTGKFIGETAVESVPGVSEGIAVRNVSRDLGEGDYVGAGIETLAGLAGLAPAGGDVLAKGLRKFNKTRKAYKLFVKSEDDKLYPLFVDANKEIKQGEFLEANFPDASFKGKRTPGSTEKNYVPTKGAKRTKGEKTKNTGDPVLIPDEATRKKLIDEGFITERSKRTKEAPFGKVTAVAARPGFHASQSPVATHLGPQDLKITKKEADKLIESGVTPEAIKRRGKQFYVKRRAEDQVFAEVDMADDIDYQSILAKEGKTDINDYVPKGGSYRYSDGQADSDQWVVGGDMKVNRVLSREEARAIQKEMGVTDLPYRDEVEAILNKKFAEGGMVMDDYLVAKTMDQTQNFAEGGMPKQMELFEPVTRGFNEGGLMDEGGTVDPISGNDVPVGSTQEEVRDDIPAQLSEGEFVLPADVVRYFGLEFIMKLRDEAKAGLAKMEAMGQMGNSEEATLDDDVPFSMEDLDMEDDGVLEYAQGGAVQAQVGAYIPPQTPTGVQFTSGSTQQSQFTPQTIAPPPPMPAMQPFNYQSPVQQQTPIYGTSATPTFSQVVSGGQGAATGASEVITIVNSATGAKKQINFIPGVTQIPEGFVRESEYTPQKQAEVETATTKPTTGVGTDDDGPGNDTTPEFSTTDVTGVGYDRSKIDNEDLLSVLNEVAISQVKSIPTGPFGFGKKIGEAAGIFGGSKTAGAVFGGVMDVFRDELGIDNNLHNLDSDRKQDLADTYRDVSNQMNDIYTSTNKEGKQVKATNKEIDSRLQAKAREFGVKDFSKFKGRAALERFVSTEIAKEVGGKKREAARKQAALVGVDYKGKSVEEINKAVSAAKAAALEAAKSESAARQRASQYQSDDDSGGYTSSPSSGYSGYSSGAAKEATGGRGSQAAGSGFGGMAKGGLVDQMKQSGLASKK